MSKLVLSANGLLSKESGKVLAEMLKHNSVLQELDVSDNYQSTPSCITDGPGFAQELAVGLSDNGAMTSLHVGMNHIPEKEMTEIIALAMGKESMKLLCEVPIKDKSLAELDVSSKSLGIEGALVVAEYLRDNGALLHFDISGNHIREEGTQALAAALNGNTTMTLLNISSNNMTYNGKTEGGKMAGIIALSDAIKDMRALSKLIFGGDYDYNTGTRPEPATLEVGMTEANFSNKNLGAGGAFIISAWITHRDKGAMTSLDVGMNNIPEKEMKEIMTIAASMESMKMLCKVPFKDKTITKLDVSGKNLGTEGALVVAEYLRDNGAMTSLNLASNHICHYGNMDGIKAISSAIKVLAIILVPISSLSDLLFNCWCLLLSPGYEGYVEVHVQR